MLLYTINSNKIYLEKLLGYFEARFNLLQFVGQIFWHNYIRLQMLYLLWY